MTSFVITPTASWLKGALSGCRSRLIAASPFVGSWLVELMSILPSRVERVLVTRMRLLDFARGASDLGAICELAEAGARVLSSPGLHAKVYVIDDQSALVTSANATGSGMTRNLECGVTLTDVDSVRTAAQLALSGFGAAKAPACWRVDDLKLCCPRLRH